MSESLALLIFALACPVGMGLMVWWMMRGNMGQQRGMSDPSILLGTSMDTPIAHVDQAGTQPMVEVQND
jgi:hypothetical protein